MTKKSVILLLVLFLFLLAIPSAFAFEGVADDTYTLGAGETVNDNLFIGAETVVIDGTVNGDVFVGGTDIEINGTINGDLFFGAQTVTINGTVEDVRGGGWKIVLNEGANITGDFMAGGMSIETYDGSLVNGDALVGGQQALLEGDINQDLMIGAGALTLNGLIGGDVKAEIGGAEDQPPLDMNQFNPQAPEVADVAPGFVMGSDAQINGDFSLESTADYTVPSNQVDGDYTYNEIVEGEEVGEEISPTQKALSRLWRLVQRWLVLVVVGFLTLRFVPRWVKSPSREVEVNPAGSLGWGVLTLFLFPIIAFFVILLLIAISVLFGLINLGGVGGTILGLGLLALGIIALLILLVSQFVAPLAVGHRVGKLIFGENSNPIIPLAVGTLIIILLMAIPFVGGLVSLVVTILGVGAAWLWWRGRNDDVDADYLEDGRDIDSLLEPI